MAGPSGRESASLSDQLFHQPYQFDFFQAVRLLEAIAREEGAHDPQSTLQPVGGDHLPHQEVVRFRALPSLSFPAGPISQIRQNESSDDSGSDRTPLREMTVAFMGLTGPSGVLPQHYTSLLIERCHVTFKDYTLRDFFDVFNHRSISLFFRAWEKYRFEFTHERFRRDPQSSGDDLFTFCLYSLVGLGTSGLRNRMTVQDDAVLYYGGHFAHGPRSAVALELLLADYFGLPVEVEQFAGRWLYLTEDVQSAMPGTAYPEGLNCELGRSVIIGKKVWEVQSKFRIKLGPLKYAEFLRFIPAGDALRPLWDLVRLYVGPEFTFDVQAILEAAEVPRCQIGRTTGVGSHLGWNTWLKSAPTPHDVGDAVFRLQEV